MLQTVINGIELKFNTSDMVFSPKAVDNGTLAMLSVVNPHEYEKILDLGCGYGVVGIYFAKIIEPEKIYMIDNSEEAVNLSKENAVLNGIEGLKIIRSDGFTELREKGFTLILSNPPYHEDFAVPKMFIEKGFNRLEIGGRLYMVTKRELWYKKKFISIFGGANIHRINDYFVFEGIKKVRTYKNKMRK